MQFASHSKARNRAGANLTLLAVLGSLLFSQFWATTHQLAVLHETCAQHGEVVDAAGAAAEFAHAGSNSQFSASYYTSNQSQHQHCPFVSSRVSHKVFKLQPLSEVERPTPFGEIKKPLAVVPHTTHALYLTAPKHSPPAA